MKNTVKLVTLYRNKVGGTEKAAECLCEILSHYHDVSIEYAYDYKKKNKISKIDQFLFLLKSIFFLNKSDVYITTDISMYYTVFISNFFYKRVKHIIMWEHYPKDKNGKFWLWLDRKLKLSTKADAVVVLSEIENKKWNELKNIRSHIISNGINVVDINYHPKEFGLVYVGRITKDKGVERLIKSYLDAKVIKEPLYIVGDGEELSNLKNKYSKNSNVFFLGTRDDVQDILSRTKIFVSGSFYECFPISVLEAMAHGVPIVSFDNSGGTESVLSKSKSGFIVSDMNEFSAKIQFLLECDNASKVGLLGREYVKKEYSLSSYENKWLKLINDVTTIEKYNL